MPEMAERYQGDDSFGPFSRADRRVLEAPWGWRDPASPEMTRRY